MYCIIVVHILSTYILYEYLAKSFFCKQINDALLLKYTKYHFENSNLHVDAKRNKLGNFSLLITLTDERISDILVYIHRVPYNPL